jgi:hypothetical protein
MRFASILAAGLCIGPSTGGHAKDVLITLRSASQSRDFAAFHCVAGKSCEGDNPLLVDGVPMLAQYSFRVYDGGRNGPEVEFLPIYARGCRFSLQASPSPVFRVGIHTGDLNLVSCDGFENMVKNGTFVAQVFVTVSDRE